MSLFAVDIRTEHHELFAAQPAEHVGTPQPVTDALQRALHTLKGSSRLAGAMRLGEMAHRLESAIEQIDVETVTADQVEPLQASFDGAVTKAHWFIDNRYLGAVTPGETLLWQGEAGTFQLRVVDDLGGVASISLQLRDSL